MTGTAFALVTRDELWSLGSEHILLERRLIHGVATRHGDEIRASDSLDPECDRICLAEMSSFGRRMLDSVRSSAGSRPGTIRLIVSAWQDGGTVSSHSSCSLTMGSMSLISDAEHIGADAMLLATVSARDPEISIDYRTVPILWRNGSGAVLLHEAAGHPAELLHHPIDWPRWLSVNDGDADLLRGSSPLKMRRASFADIPVRRMSHLVARQDGAAFDLPERRLEVQLVAAGGYEPLTGMVTLQIPAADLIDGESIRAVRPFTLHETRQAVAKALIGAGGDPLRYPGVVCSREGQSLVVGSEAPLMLTSF